MITSLIIPVYKRPQYLKRCFDSLKRADLQSIDMLILINDCGNDPEVDALYESFSIPHVPTSHIRNESNKGIRSCIKEGVEDAKDSGCDTFIVMDSDMIVRVNFANEILRLKAKYSDNMVSGINCTMRQKTGEERNPIISEHEDHYLKKYVAGQCLCFNEYQYENFVRPALLINGNWDHNASIRSDEAGFPIVVCRPSVCQHIGFESSMGHNAYGEAPDRADDFDDRLELSDVTLFGIDAFNQQGIIRAAEICQRSIRFGDVKIITDRIFPGATREEGRRNYSEFMIKHLTEYFTTGHVLTIHDDGYIQNPAAWKDEWLEWDYIGAVWDWYQEHQCGNGGFSLRSKKLCDILATDPYITETHPEDHHICRTYRQYLEDKYNIRFAPVEVCKKFSIEGWGLKYEYQVYNGEFGFHGRILRNLPIPIK